MIIKSIELNCSSDEDVKVINDLLDGKEVSLPDHLCGIPLNEEK